MNAGIKRKLYKASHRLWIRIPENFKSQFRKSSVFAKLRKWLTFNLFDSEIFPSIQTNFICQEYLKWDLVITSFKQSIFLQECINSVLSQSVQPNKVILVVHDEDEKEKIEILRISEKTKLQLNLEVYFIEDCWPGKARNFGAHKCTSDSIMFLDADDEITSNYAFNAMLCMNLFQVDFVGSWCEIFGENIKKEIWEVPIYPQTLDYESKNSSPVPSLISKKMFNNIGGWRDFRNDGTKIDEALDFWRRAKLNGYLGFNIQSPLIRVRKHQRNRSSAVSEKKFFNSKFLKKEFGLYLKEFGKGNLVANAPLQGNLIVLREVLEKLIKGGTSNHLILMADLKPFGAGKVAADLTKNMTDQGKFPILVNLDIQGLGGGIEQHLPYRMPVIELGSITNHANWQRYFFTIIDIFKITTAFSLCHPFANDLLVNLKLFQKKFTTFVFLFNTESAHAKWIESNPNIFDYLLVENNHSYNWAINCGWLPRSVIKVSHLAHRYFNNLEVNLQITNDSHFDSLNVLWFHRFASEKQPNNFIKLAQLASYRKINIKFIMGGEGPLRYSFEKIINELGQIDLLPENASVLESFENSDVFIVTSSKVEGRPLACMEALETGILLFMPELPSLLDFQVDGYKGIHFYASESDLLNQLSHLDIQNVRDNRTIRASKNKIISDNRLNSGNSFQKILNGSLNLD